MILGTLCSCGSILGYFVAGSWPGVVCWSACAPGYRAVHGRRLRLFRPRSYTAKMQWRKAVDRDPDPHRHGVRFFAFIAGIGQAISRLAATYWEYTLADPIAWRSIVDGW